MIDWSSCLDVERDPDRVSGAWVFRGTRVPVAALFENLEEDASVHQFVERFPGVSFFSGSPYSGVRGQVNLAGCLSARLC